MLTLIVPFVLLFGAIFAVVASDQPDPPADFTFINRGDVTTLDPQRMSWMQDLRVARLLFEPLVRLDVMTKDYQIVPGVAEREAAAVEQRNPHGRLAALLRRPPSPLLSSPPMPRGEE